MKKTRLFVSVLLAVLLLAVSVAPAFADYTPVNVKGNPAQAENATVVKHRLTLTEDGANYLPYAITYTFTVGNPEVEFPTGVAAADVSKMVEGKPTISNVVYTAGATFTDKDDSNKYYKENDLTISWNGVSIKQPGIYTWSVSEKATSQANQAVSEQLQNGKIKVWVVDDYGTLKLGGWFFLNASAKGNIYDTYPATTADLSVTKEVTGQMGSREEYFKFTISLTTPTGAAQKNYTISGYDPATTVNASGYNIGATQPTGAISLTGGTAGTFDVWLKHGQTVKIEDLPYGTTYTIDEADHTHYRANGEITNAKQLTADIIEKITNISEETPPTGINLNTAAPVFGIVLVGLLMAVVLFSKRKQNENA